MTHSTRQLEYTFKDDLNRRGIGGRVFQENGVLEGVWEVQSKMIRVLNNAGDDASAGINVSNDDLLDGMAILIGDGTNHTTNVCMGEKVLQCYTSILNSKNEITNYHYLLVFRWQHPRVPPLKFIKAYNFPNNKNIGIYIYIYIR